MAKFFNKPQLGQTNIQQAEQTSLSGVDNAANTKAARADKSIEMLMGVTNSALNFAGKYNANIEATRRLQSGEQIPKYQQRVRAEMSQIQNLEALSSEEMESKIKEINESFMEGYDDSPYRDQLKNDLGSMKKNVLNQMLMGRDNLHIKKVSDATAGKATSFANQFSEGNLSLQDMESNIAKLVDDSMIAHQVPTSNELGIDDASREKYMSLTRKQAVDSVMRGVMVQVGNPKNSNVAKYIGTKSFRDNMGISDGDEDYNKLVSVAANKGAKADKFNYTQGVDTFKGSLYTMTNQGVTVDIDKQVANFKAQGKELSPQDEHKLRKEFNIENGVVTTSADYVKGLTIGKDVTAGMSSKEREAIYNRSFTDTLGITDSGASIGNISGSLGVAENQQSFKDYIQSGGKMPKAVIGLFDVPAGADVDKWNEANAAIMSMEASAAGSGYSVEEIIGVKQVSKIRGLSRLLNDDTMDEATKKNAIEAFHTRSTTFNSKGYLQGTEATRIDPEWIEDVSKDAAWTTDDYVSNQQNADEIAGNYQAYRLAGHDASTAQSMALDLFKESNTSFEMPDGGEIVIPKAHIYLNNESIIAFAKDASRFPSIKEQRDDIALLTGEGWISEWRADRNISIQKSYNFSKTGKYDMLFDGKLVKDSSFTYSEMQDFIGTVDHKTRAKITGVKSERPFKEIEAEALGQRKKNIKGKLSSEERMQHIFDLTI